MSPAKAKASIQEFLDSQTGWQDLSEDFAFSVVWVAHEFKQKIEYVMDMDIWKFNEIIINLQKIYKMKYGENQSRSVSPSTLG